MTPRCPDTTDSDPVIRTFQCVLDAGHQGPHVPYVPPTVDEWRSAQAEMAGMRGFFGLLAGGNRVYEVVA